MCHKLFHPLAGLICSVFPEHTQAVFKFPAEVAQTLRSDVLFYWSWTIVSCQIWFIFKTIRPEFMWFFERVMLWTWRLSPSLSVGSSQLVKRGSRNLNKNVLNNDQGLQCERSLSLTNLHFFLFCWGWVLWWWWWGAFWEQCIHIRTVNDNNNLILKSLLCAASCRTCCKLTLSPSPFFFCSEVKHHQQGAAAPERCTQQTVLKVPSSKALQPQLLQWTIAGLHTKQSSRCSVIIVSNALSAAGQWKFDF